MSLSSSLSIEVCPRQKPMLTIFQPSEVPDRVLPVPGFRQKIREWHLGFCLVIWSCIPLQHTLAA